MYLVEYYPGIQSLNIVRQKLTEKYNFQHLKLFDATIALK